MVRGSQGKYGVHGLKYRWYINQVYEEVHPFLVGPKLPQFCDDIIKLHDEGFPVSAVINLDGSCPTIFLFV